MSSYELDRRTLLALAGASAAAPGCISFGDSGGPEGWRWPTVGGSVRNDWRAPSAEPPSRWLAAVDEWDVGGRPTPVARDETVLLAGEEVVALDGDLSERWRRHEAVEGWRTCALGPQRGYAAEPGERLVALDLESGDVDWEVVVATVDDRLLPTDEALYLTELEYPRGEGSLDVRLRALDPSDGSDLWRLPVDQSAGAAVADEHVIVAAGDQLVAVDRAGGETAWTHEPEVEGPSRPTVADGTVLYASEAGTLYALEPESGDVRWRDPDGPGGTLVVRGERLLARRGEELLAWDLATGEREVVSSGLADDRLFAGDDALFTAGVTVAGAASPDGPWHDGRRISREHAAVIDEGLLVSTGDGDVQLFATAPRVADVFDVDAVGPTDRVVHVVPDGEPRFEPAVPRIERGTTVHFGWHAAWGGLEVAERPEGAEWAPGGEQRERGATTAHAFSTSGRYDLLATGSQGRARCTVLVDEAGELRHVAVGPVRDRRLDPSPLRISAGTTVRWEWLSDGHSLVPTRTPEEATWAGHEWIEDDGFAHEHTFEIPGQYSYHCDSHADDASGQVLVEDETGEVPVDPEVAVGPGGRLAFEPASLAFEPASLAVEPGTTVRWEWDSDDHNVNPVSVPRGASWAGHPRVEDRGHVYEHTFEEPGTYEYESTPHATAGMTGTIVVGEE